MNAESAIRVLCVDDNQQVADALRIRLGTERNLQWQGWAEDADAMLELAQQTDPHVIILDLDMPGRDPFEAITELHQGCPECRVVVFSGHVRKSLIESAINAGAWGYVSKSDGADALTDAIRKVAAGDFAFSPEARAAYNRSAQANFRITSPVNSNSIEQSELDRLVTERFAWADRFASAVRHDLGNIVLFSTPPRDDDDALPEALRACRRQQTDLTAHLRRIIAAMNLWRQENGHEPEPMTVKAWWAMHSGMMRQFAPRDTRVQITAAPDDLWVDVQQLTRAVAALFLAIAAQMEPPARIALTVLPSDIPDQLRLRLVISPSGRADSIVLPRLLQSQIAGEKSSIQGRLEKDSVHLAVELRTATPPFQETIEHDF